MGRASSSGAGGSLRDGDMLAISVRADVDAVLAKLGAVPAHVRRSTAIALHRTAEAVRDAEVREIKDVFDRPTPYTLNAVYIRNVREYLAWEIGLKDVTGKGGAAAQYLAPEIAGGERPLKRFEGALRRAGLLPEGMVAVPGNAAILDGYGNMSRAQIVAMLSYFRTFGEQGYKANITDKRKAKLARGTKARRGFAYFVGRPGDGKLPLGIWRRIASAFGSAVQPVMIFVDGASYEPRYDFEYVARLAVERNFAREFEAAIAQGAR